MQSCFQIKHDAEVRGLLNKLTRPRMMIIKARSLVADDKSKLELTETLLVTVNEDTQHESFPRPRAIELGENLHLQCLGMKY